MRNEKGNWMMAVIYWLCALALVVVLIYHAFFETVTKVVIIAVAISSAVLGLSTGDLVHAVKDLRRARRERKAKQECAVSTDAERVSANEAEPQNAAAQ